MPMSVTALLVSMPWLVGTFEEGLCVIVSRGGPEHSVTSVSVLVVYVKSYLVRN